MECIPCSDGSDIMQTVIQIKSIPALCFHVLASHYVFHNFSQSTVAKQLWQYRQRAASILSPPHHHLLLGLTLVTPP